MEQRQTEFRDADRPEQRGVNLVASRLGVAQQRTDCRAAVLGVVETDDDTFATHEGRYAGRPVAAAARDFDQVVPRGFIGVDVA